MKKDKVQMIDFTLVSPIIGILATVDIVVHLYLDIQKIKRNRIAFRDSDNTPPAALAIVVISTLLAFLLVFLVSIAWLVPIESLMVGLLIPVFDPPVWFWSAGVIVLGIGIVLHLWFRAVRRTDALAWSKGDSSALVTNGLCFSSTGEQEVRRILVHLSQTDYVSVRQVNKKFDGF